MKLFIPKNYFNGNPIPPRAFLCTVGNKRIGELRLSDLSGDFKWNTYSEIQFVVNRNYTDILTGETIIDPLFDKIETPRTIYLENIGFFQIQDVDTSYGEKDEVQVSAFSLEYSAGQKYLNTFVINKGIEESKEVIYAADYYGPDAKMEDMYKLASASSYDSNEKYFHRAYTDSRNYKYEQIEIKDESKYAEHFGEKVASGDVLYIRGWAPVTFYDPNTPELSLLHLIFNELPGWKIGNVDYNLRHQIRSFEEDRVAIYDFITETVCDTFKCVCEWDTTTMEVNFYEEAEDGINDDNTIQTRWDTDVFVSRSNLASQIDVAYSADNIKTKLKVSGSDDLNIREVNLGKDYIMNLGYYHTLDWMEQDLFDKYTAYLDAIELYNPQYTEAMQNWVGAYNKWNDLMNAVPAEDNVVLVGDEFKKLYCVYTPIDTAYSKTTINDSIQTLDTLYEDEKYTKAIDKSTLSNGDMFGVQGYTFAYQSSTKKFIYKRNMIKEVALPELKKKLGLYHVDEDIKANVSDNILLKLKNKDSDTATIRIYNANTTGTDEEREKNPIYKIHVVTVGAQSGIESDPQIHEIDDWIKGNLTKKIMKLEDYTVTYIGTMGAYFVLAKDETVKENLQDYGVRLLQEKHKTYTTVFQTQTEQMFSNEGYQCVVSDTEPTGNIAKNTRWLDSNSEPMKLYQYKNGDWVEIQASVPKQDQEKYENYQRYIDNYNKLKAVQEVLIEKEKQATYMGDGYAVSGRKININSYVKGDDGVLRYNGQTLEDDMARKGEDHFGFLTSRRFINQNIPIYYFTTSDDPITYAKNTGDYDSTQQYYVKSSHLPIPISDQEDFNRYDGTTEEKTLYVLKSQHPNVYEKAPTTYDVSKRYYIKSTGSVEIPIEIDSKETFDKYDGTTDEKSLYVIVKGHIYAVYLKGTTPYVSYADSQGVYQATKDWITKQTDLEEFFDEDQWSRLSPFIREDEFNDSNFLLTSYESEKERLEIYQELKEAAEKELKTLCQPSLEFSMDMANILALPEFEPLFDQFQLGNFVRVHIRDDYVKRARLLEIHLNFSDLSDFSCNFGNLVTTKSEIDKHAELLSQAITAGKQVATSAGNWQRAVDKSNKLEEEIANGLQNGVLEVGRASGQAISWNEQGIQCRKFVDGTTDQYEDEQIAIINNKIVFTNDGWKTSKAALGEFSLDINGDGVEESMYGLLADAVVSGYIKGSVIEGGSLKIGGSGGTFIVHENGSVQILAADAKTPIYATKSDVDLVNKAIQYHIELSYDKSTIFGIPGQNCTLTCEVYKGNDKITTKLPSETTFSWLRNGVVYKTTTKPELKITNDDIERNAIFSCSVTFDETQIQ